MASDSVSLIVDKRSIQSFTKKVDALINVVDSDMQDELEQFCEDVLYDSNSEIPVDTGTAAESAGYVIESFGRGIRSRMGYAISKDPVNPRTGEAASSYITALHEDITVPHANGSAKFFERALYKHSESFYSKGRERMRARLSSNTIDTSRSLPHIKKDYLAPAQARVSSGFTATKAKGRYLPYPLKGGVA